MRILWRVLAILVLIAALVGVGFYAYNLGMTQALAQKAPVVVEGTVPMHYQPYGVPFFGFGMGLLGCLAPLFLLFVFFGAMRMLFWHGPRHWEHTHMHRRHWDWQGEDGKGVPPFFAEWHRRAHGEPENKPEARPEGAANKQ